MQISRCFLVACAAACSTTLAVRGNDTPAQIKAREALRQKMQEDLAQPSSTAAPPPQPATAASPAAPEAAPPAAPTNPRADSEAIAKAREAVHQKLQEAPAPIPAAASQPLVAAPVPVAVSAAPDAPVPPPAPVVQQADPEAIAKAREALHQKLEESPAVPPAAPTPVPAPNPPPVAAAPAPVSAPPPVVAPPTSPSPAPPPVDADAIAKAREAVRQIIAQDSEVGPKADSESIAKAREAVRQRTQSMNFAEPTSLAGNSPSMNFPPLEGPPLPISSDQQQRLRVLLQRYKADQITPEQYQAERAKILAAP